MLSKKQKLSIYKELLKDVCNDPSTKAGFCFYLNQISYRRGRCFYVYGEGLKTYFLELYAYKPEGATSWNFWFARNQKGWQKRIDILVKIIKQLEK